MIASPIANGPGVPLQIHLTDGSIESLVLPDQATAQQIWAHTEPARFFAQPRLVVAGKYSKSVFVCSEIVRMDFLELNCSSWKFPEDCSDVVELSQSDFAERAHLAHPELMAERDPSVPVGDVMVSYVKLLFRNHPPIYLIFEFSVKLPADNMKYMRHLLSKTGFQMRLANGGASMVNLAHLAGYTAYPGVAQVPSDAWPAEPAEYYYSQTRAEAA